MNEQDKLKNQYPKCAFCGGNKDQVKKLVKVHANYICSTCCKRIDKLMKMTDPVPPEAA